MTNLITCLSAWIGVPLASSALVVLISFQSCYLTTPALSSPPTEEELTRLDPTGLVEAYWTAALASDNGTIKTLVGEYPDSMIWECPQSETALREPTVKNGANVHFEIKGQAPVSTSIDIENKLDEIQRWARTIGAAKKTLTADYNYSTQEFKDEARVTARPKESPNPSNSYVFFIHKKGDQWKLVDLRVEDHLRFVGNKRFGEARECASNARATNPSD